MDKLAQIRQLRESRTQRRVAAIMSRRTPPSPAKVKEIADRAEAGRSVTLPQPRAGMEITIKATSSPLTVKPNARETIVYGGGRQQGKTEKMDAAPAQDWSKSLYQKLYMTMKRATTPEAREAAEKALRDAFPNTRPRSQSLQQPIAPIKKPDGLSDVERKALQRIPPKQIKKGSQKVLRSLKSCKAKAKKKKGGR